MTSQFYEADPYPVESGGLIRRTALLRMMDEAASQPVTLLSAPAGSGKTLLIRSWLEERRLLDRAAWVSVRRGERDDQRFWGSVVDALRAVASGGTLIEALTPAPFFNGQAMVERLLSQLRTLERELILAVDDLHELASPTALAQFEAFVDQLPPAVRVVLATRHDLPLGLHRRRLAQQLTEIRAAHLRFTLEETRELLLSAGSVLSDAAVVQLHERAEGWPAGVRLAALSLADHPDPERFVADFSGTERTVADYLLAEVLARQPDDVRTLLLRTSVLNRVNGALGDVLTGRSGADAALRALEASGAFVIALDPARTWFRYHQLFADLLALELRRTEPEEVFRLHATAARWYASHGHVVDAITHAQAGGEWAYAAALLADHFFSLILDGRRATARALLGDFAAEALAADPEFALVIAADQLVGGSLDDAAAYLALAERLSDKVRRDRRLRFELGLSMVKLALARQRGDFRSVVNQSEACDVLLEVRDARDISLYNDTRALALMDLGIAETWAGRLDDGTRHLKEACELSRQINRPYIEGGALAHLGYALRWQSFASAERASQDALSIARKHGWETDASIAPALATLAVTSMQSGRLDEADEWLDRAHRALRARTEPTTGLLVHMVRGIVLMVRGRTEEGIASLRRAERLEVLLASSPPMALQLRASILEAQLRLGQVASVRAALQSMSDFELEQGEIRIVIAVLALADGKPQAATDALAPVTAGISPVHHVGVLVRALALGAVAHYNFGDTRASENALERALDLAVPHVLVIPFLFHPVSPGLLDRHPRHRTAHGPFVKDILDLLGGISRESGQARALASGTLLSYSELRVLRLLPTNSPVSDMAAELQISVNTVKTHMRHIYAKFDQHTRAGAVERARELGLLAPTGRS